MPQGTVRLRANYRCVFTSGNTSVSAFVRVIDFSTFPLCLW
uniref:Uncharacterized protein n=1 Tax=Anguilla anguilla TaxID=7936 RepID=A0A0E9R6T5_ANGAN